MSDEQALKNVIDALDRATEANRQMTEANRKLMDMASKIVASFSEASASMERTASRLEALSQAHEEEPVAQATRTKFSPTHEVSNDGDDLIKVPVGDDESGDSYLAYDFGATGMNRSKDQYDRLYEACLASRKEVEFHAMMLQLAQNMAALKSYERSDEVIEAERAVLDALYDDAAIDDGLDYRDGLDADWDALLANLQKALGLDVSQDEDFENSDD